MSLPQRKKTAEEIAKLRESLGIGGVPPADPALTESAAAPAVAELPATEPIIAEISAPPAVVEMPPLPQVLPTIPQAEESPPVRELKHPERAPVLAVELSGPPQEHPAPHEPEPEPEEIAIPLPAPRAGKVVRSLRKSEQGPVVPAHRPAAKNSSLPVHRHSDEEIARIRRMEMAAKANLPPPPPAPTAHLAVVIPGYLAAFAGAACFIDDAQRQRLPIIVSCLVAALLIATYIFVRKPYSRHHSGFIAVITLFTIVFGALYYFPQLLHGT